MPDLGLTHVALPVRSLEASIAFYARYAHMVVFHRREGVAWIGDGTRSFVIVLLESKDPILPLAPFAHLGVAIESKAEVDRLCALARAEGCLLRGPADDGPPVGYWSFLRDPDGHTLELAFGQEVALAVEQGS